MIDTLQRTLPLFSYLTILIITLSLFFSTLCAALIFRYGSRIGFVDKPNERSSHSNPTPRSGGIGIWLAFIIVGTILTRYQVITLSAGIVGLIGLIEDRFSLSAKSRLIIQLIISALVISQLTGLSLRTYHPLFLTSHSSLFLLLLFLFQILFITGTANFYNFMDGINGIAGLTGLVGFGLLAFYSYYIADKPDVTLMSLVLSVGCAGFLPLNFPKARVFMGDVGSIFLGFIFAFFVLKLSVSINIFLCLSMFLCTFYSDAIITIYYRWRRGENLMQAHRSHLYQYLSNELRLPQWKVSALYAGLQFVFGLLSLVTFKHGLLWQLGLIGLFVILFTMSYRFIKNIKPAVEK